MFARKFQLLTQALGVLCLFGLAGYGLFIILTHDAIAWAMPLGAKPRAPITALDQAPQLQGNLSVPLLMNYQGELKDANGNPLSGAYNMTFRIYDSVSAGTALWTEQQNNVTVRNGVFSVLLGSTTAMPGDIFHSASRFMGVTVSPYAEMAPRQRLSSVPYAVWSHEAYYSVYSGEANTLDGLDNTAFSRNGHTHDDRYYTGDALRTNNAAPVTWGNLFNIPPGFGDGVDNEGLNGPVAIETRQAAGATCVNPVWGSQFSDADYQFRLCIGGNCSSWLTYACTRYFYDGGGGARSGQ